MAVKIALIILAVSADVFVAAAGLGSAGIKVPFLSSFIISMTGTVSLGASVYFAGWLGSFFPPLLCRIASAALLVSLGLVNLFYGRLKSAAEKREKEHDPLKLFFDGSAADKDGSKTLSCREAFALSLVLSFDALVTGLSAGLGETAFLPLVAAAFTVGLAAMLSGVFIGRHAHSAGKADLQRVCGVILIALAFFR